MLVSLSVDDAVPDRPTLRLFIVSVPAAFLFIFFSPVQHVRFSLHFTCSLFRPFPPPDIRIYYPPSPHPPPPRVWPSLIYPKTPRPIIQSQPQCPLVTLPHPLFYLSLALIASAMYYPYFSVIMQYDEKLRRLRRNIYSGNFRSYMVRRNTRALSFFFSVPDIC